MSGAQTRLSQGFFPACQVFQTLRFLSIRQTDQTGHRQRASVPRPEHSSCTPAGPPQSLVPPLSPRRRQSPAQDPACARLCGWNFKPTRNRGPMQTDSVAIHPNRQRAVAELPSVALRSPRGRPVLASVAGSRLVSPEKRRVARLLSSIVCLSVCFSRSVWAWRLLCLTVELASSAAQIWPTTKRPRNECSNSMPMERLRASNAMGARRTARKAEPRPFLEIVAAGAGVAGLGPRFVFGLLLAWACSSRR